MIAAFHDGFKSRALNVQTFDVNAFLSQVALNAKAAAIPGVALTPGTQSVTAITNERLPFVTELIEKIFEYGVSDQPDAGALGQRGQGLFVAKTYMAKMGGTIFINNTNVGVRFDLRLPRSSHGY